MFVSSSPHIKDKSSTTRIMLDVIIALIPSLIVSVIRFGLHALALALVCVGSAVLSEYIARKVMKRDNTIGDLSAVVTGLILSLNLPSTLPLWMGAFGSLVAIVVIKQFFGGLGQNFVNPAIGARIILMLCFTSAMTAWTKPGFTLWADGVTSASPLAELSEAANGSAMLDKMPSFLQMLLGDRAGSMGETCALAIIAGGIYLCVRKVITPVIPLSFIGTVFVCMLVKKFDIQFALYELLSGGLLFGAVFMATDYATSPINTKGKIVFGIGCGLITSAIRLFGSLPEGVSYSIILMNILVPHIDNLTLTRPFGAVKEAKNGKA